MTSTDIKIGIGQMNASWQIIAAVPAVNVAGLREYVVAAVRDRDGRPFEYVTWRTRTDQPGGFYWGNYNLADERAALADMLDRAGLVS